MGQALPKVPQDDETGLPVTVSASAAAKNFGEVIDNLSDRPVVVTRYGRPKAYILSPSEYAKLGGHVEKREAVRVRDIGDEEWAAIEEANSDLLG